MLGGASDRDGIDGALARFSKRIGKKYSLEIGTPYAHTQALASVVLNAFVASIADSDNPESPELVDAANALLSFKSSASRWGCSPIRRQTRPTVDSDDCFGSGGALSAGF